MSLPAHISDIRIPGRTGSASPAKLRIAATSGRLRLNLGEVWRSRELLFFLIWRDVKVRYKQTALGVAWAILQPLLTMLIFTFFFGRLAQMPSDGLPYPIFSLAGILPWSYFCQSLSQASQSLVGSANMLRKVYFPRLVIPLSATASGLIDFGIAFVLLLGLLLTYGVHLGVRLLLLPLFLMLAFITALGAGVWLSALSVQYRDVRHIMPFLIQFWMFATPVVYPSSLLQGPWREIFGLNPMVGVVEGFRWALLGTAPPGNMLLLSAIVALAVVVSGLLYFRKMESQFSDVI
jgi:lipopolysaccharide transport system permease protein